MTTQTQVQPQVTVQPSVQNQVSQGVQQVTSGLSSYVNTPVINTMNYPKLAGTVVGAYVVLEVINHFVLGTYIMPYLATLGLGATALGAIFYGTLGIAALGLSWLAYKFFFKKKPTQVQQNVTYVPVNNT